MKNDLTHIKTIKMMKEFFLFSIIIFHWMGCKDKEPITPKPDPANNEYTFKGKLINGTYNTPINPGMVMTAVVSHTDVFNSKSEELATFRIGQDGSFEFKYKHSKLAENNSATLKLTSQFFVSDPLPKNRDLDTILYRSTWGGGVIVFESENPIRQNDTFYVALTDSFFVFTGPIERIEKKSFRCKNLKANYHSFWAIGKQDFYNTRLPIPKNRAIYYIPSGDPISDTIRIKY
jgi:hypothetical protein